MPREPRIPRLDTTINAIMLDVRESLADELAETILGPPGQTDVVWRDQLDSRGCDCNNGRAWIRWASGAREINLNATVCGYSPSLYQLEIGVMRCIQEPIKQLASSEWHTEATAAMHSDRCAIQRAVRRIGRRLDEQTKPRGQLWIQASQPWGPQAGCMGNLATVHYRVR